MELPHQQPQLNDNSGILKNVGNQTVSGPRWLL